MKTFIGIDLGSTTTKAVVMDEARTVLGRGITNSRSNYDTAAAIAKQEALIAARFQLFRGELQKAGALNGGLENFIGQLERDFRLEQYLEQLADLEQVCARNVESAKFGDASAVAAALRTLFALLQQDAAALFAPGARRKSDFFRDIAGAQYLALGEKVAKDAGVRYDQLLNVFDRSIIEVENRVYDASIKTAPAGGPGAHLQGLARHVETQAGHHVSHSIRPRHRHGGDLRRRHGLRARAAAVLEGAHPLRDPVPRPGRARDVPEHRDGARHRRPGHQGDPGRQEPASSSRSR